MSYDLSPGSGGCSSFHLNSRFDINKQTSSPSYGFGNEVNELQVDFSSDTEDDNISPKEDLPPVTPPPAQIINTEKIIQDPKKKSKKHTRKTEPSRKRHSSKAEPNPCLEPAPQLLFEGSDDSSKKNLKRTHNHSTKAEHKKSLKRKRKHKESSEKPLLLGKMSKSTIALVPRKPVPDILPLPHRHLRAPASDSRSIKPSKLPLYKSGSISQFQIPQLDVKDQHKRLPAFPNKGDGLSPLITMAETTLCEETNVFGDFKESKGRSTKNTADIDLKFETPSGLLSFQVPLISSVNDESIEKLASSTYDIPRLLHHAKVSS